MRGTKHAFLEGLTPVAVLAHRGGRSESHPENSLPAFEEAILQGAQILETDLHVSKDGVLVASHDAKVGDLNIPKAHSREIAERTEGQVALYPFFNDLLEALPADTRWNIDPKSGRAAAILCDLLHSRPSLLNRICVGAFSDRRITMLRRNFGSALCTSMGPREAAIFLSTGRTKANVAQLPLHLFGRQIVTERVVGLCRQAGIDLHAWTLNTPESIEEARSLGVDGVVTDEIELAVALLAAER